MSATRCRRRGEDHGSLFHLKRNLSSSSLLLHKDQSVITLQPSTVQSKTNLPRSPLQQNVIPPIPDRHPPCTVLSLRYLTLKTRVIQRIIIYLNRQPPDPRLRRRSSRNRPRLQHSVQLQLEIKVMMQCPVLMHDKPGQSRSTPDQKATILITTPSNSDQTEGSKDANRMSTDNRVLLHSSLRLYECFFEDCRYLFRNV